MYLLVDVACNACFLGLTLDFLMVAKICTIWTPRQLRDFGTGYALPGSHVRSIVP
jgi:hypothetical protein